MSEPFICFCDLNTQYTVITDNDVCQLCKHEHAYQFTPDNVNKIFNHLHQMINDLRNQNKENIEAMGKFAKRLDDIIAYNKATADIISMIKDIKI